MIARRMRGPVAMSFILACLVTSTTLAQAQSQQSARPQNIFEALFPGLVKERIRREQAFAPQEQAPRAPAPVQKVSAPQYYTYKVDRLARIELQSLVPAAAAAASTPTGTPAPSGDALVQSVSDVLDSSITGTANAATAPAQPAAMPAMDDAQAYASIAGRFAELSVMAEPQVGKAVVEHYKASPKLMWLDNTLQANARALAALKVLSDAGQVGLNPEDYAVSMPVVDAAAGENARLDAAARFEIALTARATRYALDAAGGLVVADRLSGYHDFPERQLSAKEALEKIAAGDPASVLPAFNPDNAPFKALVAELARLDSERDDSIAIPETVLIKPGEDSTDLPLVMAALEKRASPELKAQFADLLAAVAAPSAPSAGTSPLNATPAVVDAASAPANSAPLTSENDFGNDAAIAAPAAASEPAPQTAPGTTGGTKTAEPASGEPVTEEAANATAAPPAPSEIPATLYTLDKVELMKAFQKEAGLTPDGVIGRNTVARLTGDTVSSKRERVIIALEQLRWHPRDLGPRHVFINQPAYRARYVEGGKTKLDMRVVVGTKANQTNFFHDMIETVEYNPYWGVPQLDPRQRIPAEAAREPGLPGRARLRSDRRPGEPHRLLLDRLVCGRLGRAVRRAPVTGRGQCAWRVEDPLPQQACDLHARHAGARSFQEGRSRLQPWLRAPCGAARDGGCGAGHHGPTCRGDAHQGPWAG